MRESRSMLPALPPRAPRIHSRFWPWLARCLLRPSGWRLDGELPDVPRLVVIGAPHTSYWDGVLGLLMKVGIGVDIGIMIKREVLDGPLGIVLRPLGAVPIDRGAATGVVVQMAALFAGRERMWLGITPEGTRQPVTQWKSGFLRIARAADVAVLPVFFDYPNRRFMLGEPVTLSGDDEADMARIRALFRGYCGKYGPAD